MKKKVNYGQLFRRAKEITSRTPGMWWWMFIITLFGGGVISSNTGSTSLASIRRVLQQIQISGFSNWITTVAIVSAIISVIGFFIRPLAHGAIVHMAYEQRGGGGSQTFQQGWLAGKKYFQELLIAQVILLAPFILLGAVDAFIAAKTFEFGATVIEKLPSILSGNVTTNTSILSAYLGRIFLSIGISSFFVIFFIWLVIAVTWVLLGIITTRSIVIEQLKAIDGIKRAWAVLRKQWRSLLNMMLLLVIILLIPLLLIGFIASLLMGPFFSSIDPLDILQNGLPVGIAVISSIVSLVSLFISSILNTFFETTLTLWYVKVTGYKRKRLST